MTTAFNHTELFGGAITANIPSSFADVRLFHAFLKSYLHASHYEYCYPNIRQVPDNQEVYLDKNGFTSLTFDITERVSHLSTDKEALEYHFADIVAEIDSKHIWSIAENVELSNFPPTTPILALTATTKPPPSTVAAKALTPTHTDIRFTLIRLVEQDTDIVITLNTPHFADETDGHILKETEAGTRRQDTKQEAENMYHQIITSFKIKDWGLFSGE